MNIKYLQVEDIKKQVDKHIGENKKLIVTKGLRIKGKKIFKLDILKELRIEETYIIIKFESGIEIVVTIDGTTFIYEQSSRLKIVNQNIYISINPRECIKYVNLEKELLERGISIEELASCIDVNKEAILRMLNNRIDMTFDQACKIRNTYFKDLTFSFLFKSNMNKIEKIFDYTNIKIKINDKFKSMNEFANELGENIDVLNSRLNNKSEFTIGEIDKIANVLDIPKAKLDKYFFNII
ncbi:Helix-turn-helix [[Clostridium] sordellii]|uniref:DUF739 family protein n=1 Tax=Paraclostridium sordellii TaxID=1505 RepID=UPI0005DB6F3C|nr:DUF739 family protein [Paeniclostridium sordellii]CEO36549.1 Helix-turn-helix [[Clostridium] sordellii] [Paeniclostridium sordellii]